MRDQDHRLPRRLGKQRGQEGALRLRVQPCAGLVQNEHGGALQQRARQRDAPSLATGQRGAALPKPGVEPIGQRAYGVAEGRTVQRVPKLAVRGRRPPQQQVAAYAVIEQMRGLAQPGHVAVHVRRGKLRHVRTTQEDAAGLRHRHLQG